MIVPSKWLAASQSQIVLFAPSLECDVLVTPSKLRFLNFQDDGTFTPFSFETNDFAEDSRPKWVDPDRDDVSTTAGLIALSVSPCAVECISLATSEAPGSLAPLSAGNFILLPPALGVTPLRSFLIETEERDALCETACRTDPTRAFNMGPSCVPSCGSVWIPWDSFFSLVGIKCASTRQMVIKATQRLDIISGFTVLQLPTYYMVALSLGVVVELFTDTPREESRLTCHFFSILIVVSMFLMSSEAFAFNFETGFAMVILMRAFYDVSGNHAHHWFSESAKN